MADKSIGAHVGGPEDRVASAKLGFGHTVIVSDTYADRRSQGSLLSVSASPSVSDKFYKNVVRVPESSAPLSISVAVSDDTMKTSEETRVALDSVKKWSVEGTLPFMPSDVYRQYLGDRLSNVFGASPCTAQTQVSQTIWGGLTGVEDHLPEGLDASPGYRYPYVENYSSVTTGVPGCYGLTSTSSSHENTYQWGENYDYSSYGICYLPFDFYRKEVVSGIRYDVGRRAFIVQHSSLSIVSGVRPVSSDSTNHISRYYGSYGTFNPWDTCTYPQQFTNVTNSQSHSESHQKSDRARFCISESIMPELPDNVPSLSTIRAKVSLDLSGVTSFAGATVPCSVVVSIRGYELILTGRFRTSDKYLRTDRYNPLGLTYAVWADYDASWRTPSAALPMSLYSRQYHDTLEKCNLPKGFYYAYPAAGTIAIKKSDVLSSVEIADAGGKVIGRMAYEFYVELGSSFTAKYFLCLGLPSASAMQHAIINTGRFPTYISDAEMSPSDVYIAASNSVLTAAKATYDFPHNVLCRAIDVGIQLTPFATLFEDDVAVIEDSSYLTDVTGVKVCTLDAVNRGASTNTSSSVTTWPIMSPWGMEGWGSGVDSTEVTNTPDGRQLAWSNLDYTAVTRMNNPYIGVTTLEVLKYSGLRTEKTAETDTTGRYTNSYARPIDTETTSTEYSIRASVDSGYALLVTGNNPPVSLTIPPSILTYTTESASSRPAVVGAHTTSTQTNTVIPASSKTYALCDASGARVDVVTVAYSGMSVSSENTDGVNNTWSVDQYGDTTVTSLVGALDIHAMGGVVSADGVAGIPAEGIAYVAGGFLKAGGAVIKCLPLTDIDPIPFSFPSPVAGSPVGVELAWLTAPYVSSSSLQFSMMAQGKSNATTIVWPTGWDMHVIDDDTGVSVYSSVVKQGSSWLSFAIPLTGRMMPARWHFEIAPYVRTSSNAMYGEVAFTSISFSGAVGCYSIGGTVENRVDKFDGMYGQNGYYGGSPPDVPPGSIDKYGSSVRKDAYLGVTAIAPSIGISAGYAEWLVEGESVRYCPFIWYSNITGATGYCVGARAVSINGLSWVVRMAVKKDKYAKVTEYLDAVIADNDQQIADMEMDSNGDADSLATIAGMQDYRAILADIETKFGDRSTPAAIRGEEPPDTELLYSIFIEVAMTRVKILRNDFASPEMIFSVNSYSSVGYSFLQQTPKKKGATFLESLWL